MRWIVASCMSLAAIGLLPDAARAAGKPKLEGYLGYDVRQVHGWQVLVAESLLRASPDVAEACLELVGRQLEEIAGIVPSRRLDFLRSVPIWIDAEGSEAAKGASYHASEEWLVEFGLNPDKTECIEIPRAESYLRKAELQPMVLLHEFAHAYHHQELGFDRQDIRAAFAAARRDELYKKVPRSGSTLVRAYADFNFKEYFAELTEAFFGRNDYFPYTSQELKSHDPTGWAVVSRAWNRPEEGS